MPIICSSGPVVQSILGIFKLLVKDLLSLLVHVKSSLLVHVKSSVLVFC